MDLCRSLIQEQVKISEPTPSHLSGAEFFTGRPLPLLAATDHMGEGIAAHDHDFLEIVVVLSGHAEHCSIHGVQNIQRGDVVLLRPGTWHLYQNCQELVIFNCCFGMELLRRELAAFVSNPVLNYLFYMGPLSQNRKGVLTWQIPESALEECHAHLKVMESMVPLYGSFIEDEALAHLELTGRLILFLHELGRHLPDDESTLLRRPAALHPAVRQASRLLEEKATHAWTLKELAGELHLDPSYLVRLFKMGMGLSPMAYLARYRAEQAAALLLRGDLPIGDIGQEVGWSDPSYFAERFKDHFGLSPREYRSRFTDRV
jgi:AraC family L-rhamnose operon transcriptional activator RhaR